MPRCHCLAFAALLVVLPALSVFADKPAGLPGFRDLARKVRPAVVNLSVVKNVTMGVTDPFMDQFLGRFFRQPQGKPEEPFKQHSLGSGVIVDAMGGYVLTNNHVVEGADAITVKLADKREFPGVVVGRDPKTDLAVVKIKGASDLSALAFGDSDGVEVGDWVLAVGSPFGLEQTVSHGIISAQGRVIGDGPYDDFLQTDAPINPGNSGGPLVDLNGTIIGINTAISTQSGGSEGVGFAIPSNLARDIYRQLVSQGKVVRGWLGISIQDLDPSLALRFGMSKDAKGVLVADVLDQGPAKTAGLRSGDVITGLDGKAVNTTQELQRRVAMTPLGGKIVLSVWRNTQNTSIPVKVGAMDQSEPEGAQDSDQSSAAPKLGLEVRSMNAEESVRFAGERGVVVAKVDPASPAEDAGIEVGDLILEVGRSQVANPAEMARLIGHLKAEEGVVIRVRRDGRSLYLSLQVPANQ